MVDKVLLDEFDSAMRSIYDRALSEANYKASIFKDMLYDNGGLQTARILIHSPKVSDGYTALWERGRLDLTVEAMVLENPRWHVLFSEDELSICAKRLKEYRYETKDNSTGS